MIQTRGAKHSRRTFSDGWLTARHRHFGAALLFNNRAAIGGFDVSGSNPAGWYWSGTQYDGWNAWVQRFSDGHQVNL